MENTKLPSAMVNYHWLQLQLITTGFAALKCSSGCDFTCFGRKIKINEAYSKFYETLQTLYMYFYRSVCKKPAQNSICRSTF